MSTVEKIDNKMHGEDHGIRMTALCVLEQINGMKIQNEEKVLASAILEHMARRPFLFRENGYSWEGVKFYNHKKNSTGKLISCEARFPNEISDKEKKN